MSARPPARQSISLTTHFGATVSGYCASGHDQPARLSALQGAYDGDSLSSRQPVIGMNPQVAADGTFVTTSRKDCATSGEVFVLAMNEAKTEGGCTWVHERRRAVPKALSPAGRSTEGRPVSA